MSEVNRPLQIDVRAGELVAEAEGQYNEFNYGAAYDTYEEAVAVIREHGGMPDTEIHFMMARCLAGLGEPVDALDFLEEMRELYKEDSLIVSRVYYERGLIKSEYISTFDGLIDFDLAFEHLAGEYAPKHKKIGKPLTSTLLHLSRLKHQTLMAVIHA